MKFNNKTLRDAVAEWLKDESKAKKEKKISYFEEKSMVQSQRYFWKTRKR